MVILYTGGGSDLIRCGTFRGEDCTLFSNPGNLSFQYPQQSILANLQQLGVFSL